jgi:DNA transformation protein
MDDSFREFLADLFAPLGGVGFRKMFGGLGIFRDGQMFALVADDVLYFKADEATRAAFEAEGCGPFTYEGKDGPRSMSYWRAPERLFDEPDEFCEWALRAFAVAERAKEKKPKAARTRSAASSGAAGSSAHGRRGR